MTPPGEGAPWSDAVRVAELLAADPHGCGGVRLRAGAGPVRDAWLALLVRSLPAGRPMRRCPPDIADDRLLGGLDLAATLAAGRPVAQAGLLAEADGGLVVVPMAERLSPGTAARLAAVLDTGRLALERDGFGEGRPARVGVVLLDEGLDDEAPPAALTERLAFDLDLTGLGMRDVMASPAIDLGRIGRGSLLAEGGGRDEGRDAAGEDAPLPPRESARRGDPPASSDDAAEAVAALCAAADALGVASLRGPLLALRIARLIAARDGRVILAEADIVEAARLVLAPRATRRPAVEAPGDDAEPEPDREPSPQADTPPEPRDDAGAEPRDNREPSLDDVVLAAVQAAIPPGLLATLAAGTPLPGRSRAGKAGAAAAASRQGRPIGARAGDPRRGRLALLATLRAAAPWQRLRQAEAGATHPARTIIVRPEDFRITRYRQRSESTTIFAVDASGSAALERLAEAKGAVELLLAEAYVRRDRVALVAFRGRGADLVLPPTRSLVRAKRGLAGLPGGGGTPLAAGLDAAAAVALSVRRGGGTPLVVLLTDGRANITRAGEPGRPQATDDALVAARRFRASGCVAILIDTAPRPQEAAKTLAGAMGARYLPLPQADAGRLSAAVRSAAA
ncbi:magnesium chelatase subunit D [uncultured Methylobacterium sp.]|uniref:magnesium chelatase subunit D n=1 Tax=uncultured Methylobacterium sp. TaxID=157278 RepID=UPI0035C94B42